MYVGMMRLDKIDEDFSFSLKTCTSNNVLIYDGKKIFSFKSCVVQNHRQKTAKTRSLITAVNTAPSTPGSHKHLPDPVPVTDYIL
jgi:hypothetical protein